MNVELIRGRGRRWNPAPTTTPRHLVTLMMLLLDGSHLAPQPAPPCVPVLHSQCHRYCTPWALCQLSSGSRPVSEPAAGAGRWAALQAPWTLGNSDQRVLKVGALENKDE